jgi:hypothetical protein
MAKILYITLHQKSERDGWQAIKTLPSDSAQWDDADQQWITELFHCATDCLTVGHTMYELKAGS